MGNKSLAEVLIDWQERNVQMSQGVIGLFWLVWLYDRRWDLAQLTAASDVMDRSQALVLGEVLSLLMSGMSPGQIVELHSELATIMVAEGEVDGYPPLLTELVAGLRAIPDLIETMRTQLPADFPRDWLGLAVATFSGQTLVENGTRTESASKNSLPAGSTESVPRQPRANRHPKPSNGGSSFNEADLTATEQQVLAEFADWLKGVDVSKNVAGDDMIAFTELVPWVTGGEKAAYAYLKTWWKEDSQNYRSYGRSEMKLITNVDGRVRYFIRVNDARRFIVKVLLAAQRYQRPASTTGA